MTTKQKNNDEHTASYTTMYMEHKILELQAEEFFVFCARSSLVVVAVLFSHFSSLASNEIRDNDKHICV